MKPNLEVIPQNTSMKTQKRKYPKIPQLNPKYLKKITQN
jgi:hypothetical protein